MILTRFAPSPTGYLHVGNVRTALTNWLYTKSKGGKFLLRIDDTDKARSEEKYVDALKRDLEWLGIDWDSTARQSERQARYDEVIEQLKQMGRLYKCYETSEELDIKRKMQLNRGLPPIYDRAALKLTDEQKIAFEKEGKPVHWRFKLEDKTISWDDEVRGNINFEGSNLSDPILIRACGTPTYMLPSAIDDIDMEITHIVRGEDHITNTAIQIQIFEALNAKVPICAHVSLIKNKDDKISKRVGGFDIASLRDDNIDPLAICSLLSTLGTSDSIEVKDSMQAIIDNFDINKFGKSQANYDIEELRRLNTKILHNKDFSEVSDKVVGLGISNMDENFWSSVRGNLENLSDITTWWNICKSDIEPVIANDNAEFVAKSANYLPDGEWDENTWSQWISILKTETGRKGKQLFMPLRQALTSLDSGPELKFLLPLIGRDKVIARLKGQKG